jgi:S1-C subfamily serine protease
MHTLIKTLTFLIVAVISYFAISFYLQPTTYDDTIIYKVVEDEILLEPMVSEVATTSYNPTELEEATTEYESEETTITQVEEVKDAQKPPAIEEPILSEAIDSQTPKVETKEVKVESELTFSDINNLTRDALVNIFCATEGPHQYITPISGSGTIIDERGVILTNAHIAQFWLFEDFPTDDFVNCTIRTGSPAKAMYKAKLLYISPKWISENSNVISTENPMGTGEHDFALLLITEAVTNQVLPETFPHLPVDTSQGNILRENAILVGGYPAGFLGGRTIAQDLYASTAITEIMELYTFDDTGSLDLVSLGGTVVSQQGASGGPAVNEYGNMIGLISTASDGETTGDRDLRAVTLEHIERSLVENNKTTLKELLSGDIEEKATAFNETAAQTLLQILLRNF